MFPPQQYANDVTTNKKRKDPARDENADSDLEMMVDELSDEPETHSLKKTKSAPFFRVDIFGQPPVVREKDQTFVFAKYNNNGDVDFANFASSIYPVLVEEKMFDRRTSDPTVRGGYLSDTVLLSFIVDVDDNGNVWCKTVKLIPSDIYTVSNIAFDDKFVNLNFPQLKGEKVTQYNQRKKALNQRAENFRLYKERVYDYFYKKTLKELTLIGLDKLRNKRMTVIHFFMMRSTNLTGLVHKDSYNHTEGIINTPTHISVTNHQQGYSTQLGFNNKKSNKMITFASKPGDTMFIRNMDHCTPLINRSVLEPNKNKQTHKFELSKNTSDYQRTSRILELVNSGESESIHPDTINQIEEFESNVKSTGVRTLFRTQYFDNALDEIIDSRINYPAIHIGQIVESTDENVISVINQNNAIFHPSLKQYGMGGKRFNTHKRLQKRRKTHSRLNKKKRVTIKRNSNRKTTGRRIKYLGGGHEEGVITLSDMTNQTNLANQNDLIIPADKEFVILMDTSLLTRFCI